MTEARAEWGQWARPGPAAEGIRCAGNPVSALEDGHQGRQDFRAKPIYPILCQCKRAKVCREADRQRKRGSGKFVTLRYPAAEVAKDGEYRNLDRTNVGTRPTKRGSIRELTGSLCPQHLRRKDRADRSRDKPAISKAADV